MNFGGPQSLYSTDDSIKDVPLHSCAGKMNMLPTYTQWLLRSPTLFSNLILSSFQLESNTFIEDSLKYFQDRVSRENLLQLLTDGRAWNEFLVAAGLSR